MRFSSENASALQRLLQVRVDDLEGVGVGIVDPALLFRQGVLQQLYLHSVVGQRPGLIKPERLQIPGDDFHGGHAARFHRGDEIGALLERSLVGAPEPKALGVGQSRQGRGAGGGHIQNARVRQRILEAQPRAALPGGGDITARTLGAGRVRHRVGLVEDDDAGKRVAVLLVQAAGQPLDDLFQPRLRALAGGGPKRRVGGEQDALPMGNRIGGADLAQRDDVALGSAERGPVPAGVLEKLVGGGQPQRAAGAPQPLVQDDGGNLPTLAAAGAVAEHPAPAEPDRRGQHLAVFGRYGTALRRAVRRRTAVRRTAVRSTRVRGLDAAERFPAVADTDMHRQAPLVGLAGENDAFQLGVGQPAPRRRRFWGVSGSRTAADARRRPSLRTAPMPWDGAGRLRSGRWPAARARRVRPPARRRVERRPLPDRLRTERRTRDRRRDPNRRAVPGRLRNECRKRYGGRQPCWAAD